MNKFTKGTKTLGNKVMQVVKSKEEGSSAIVVEIGLIILAIILIAIFKDKIGTFLSGAVDNITLKLDTMLNSANISGTP